MMLLAVDRLQVRAEATAIAMHVPLVGVISIICGHHFSGLRVLFILICIDL